MYGTATIYFMSRSLILLQEFAQKLSKAQQSLAARHLMCLAAAKLLETSPEDFCIDDENTPPRLKRLDHSPVPLNFSISHRKTWVGCLTSTSPRIGFDLEIHTSRDFSSLLEDVLNAEEKAALICPDSNLETLFYRCWTAKEALGKLHGHGWSSSPLDLDLVIAAQNPAIHCAQHEWPTHQLTCAYAIQSSFETLFSPPEILFIGMTSV